MRGIEEDRYWDLPLSWVSGCTPCSPGCDHCWSAAMEHRMGARIIKGVSGSIADGTACGYEDHIPSPLTDGNRQFNGHIITHPERLSIPLKRRKPTVFAVWNDFWHESVPDDFQYKAYDAMVERHTFLILTKRPHIAAAYYAEGKHEDLLPRDNIYHGLTVCNQAEADEKIPVFLKIPGKKFLSIEPMLGAMDLSYNRFCGRMGWGPPDPPRRGENQEERLKAQSRWVLGKIDAVILGGETGPGARPMHPEWVRSVRDQCAAAGVPFFFKGWGEWAPWGGRDCDFMYLYNCDEMDKRFQSIAMPPHVMYRVGRNKAGRLLEGRPHDDLPWRTTA